jgi:Holliday junction resolvasome RuvABC endonuclease subunit
MILGIDCSTSFTGLAVLNYENNLLFCESVDTRNKKRFCNVYEKVEEVQNNLLNINSKFRITKVLIEEPVLMFAKGKSSAKTISTLSSFNGMISLVSKIIYGIVPEHIPASSARKNCGIKIPRGENTKLTVLKYVVETTPGFCYDMTKYGNPAPGTFDMADAIVVARSCLKNAKN